MVYKYKFCGGELNGQLIDEELARKMAQGFTPDNATLRASGALVCRKELDNQPKFEGYLGPMWDGTRYIVNGKIKSKYELTEEQKSSLKEAYAVLRYETQEVYNAMSE